jgi:hypothetical protein
MSHESHVGCSALALHILVMCVKSSDEDYSKCKNKTTQISISVQDVRRVFFKDESIAF